MQSASEPSGGSGMALEVVNSTPKKGLLFLAFNQDATAMSIADMKGIRIFSLETHKQCLNLEIGSIRWDAL